MPNSYTKIFGGQTINPTLLSYSAYTINENVTLQWPFEALDSTLVASDKLDIIASAAGLSIKMPDATLVSVGQDNLFLNVGTNQFTVLDNAGGVIAVVPAGQSVYIYLTDVSTAAGTWESVVFGATGGGGSAASLAGAGLKAIVSTLNQNLITTSLNSDYEPGINDRATILKNAGGSVNYSFGDATVLTEGWFTYVVNLGTGNVTLTPFAGQTIDNNASKTVGPGESCLVFSDGANLCTFGFGQSITSTITGAAINVAGSGDKPLNNSQALAQVQDYSGALTGNVTVDYGTNVGYWFVWNNTTGAFSLTLRVNNIDPGAVVPQGSFSIVRSNGTTMSVAFTAAIGSVTQINTTTDLTGGPITTTGTIGLANTAVTAGSYPSDAAHVAQFTVDGKGRLTNATQLAISLPITQVQTFSSAQFLGRLTNNSGTGLVVFNASPTLTTPTLTNPTATSGTFTDPSLLGLPTAPTATLGDNSTLVATTAFVQANITAALTNVTGFTTGDVKFSADNVEQPGWLFLDGNTIGNAASGGTARANADCLNLFTFLWNRFSNTICPVSGGRGATALADFNANKTIKLLDARGVCLVAPDNMGGASRGVLAGFTSPGVFGGGQNNSTTTFIPWQGTGGNSGGNQFLTSGTFGSAGFSIVQPTMALNVFIKL